MGYRVLITGASGLLGRALYKCFSKETTWTVLGLALNRANGDLRKVDITKQEEISKVMEEFKPDVVVHAAAERRPDIVENNEEAVKLLNVEATKFVCSQANKLGAYVIFISTDYVFDGTNPPYQVYDQTNPLNKYGLSKREGEIITLDASKGNIVLRVPILYGEVTSWEESAVTVLFPKVWDKNTSCTMSDYEIRYPTHCDDVSWILKELIQKRQKDASLTGIFHWSGKEDMTKYQMCITMAKVFNLPTAHITADRSPSGGAKRPYDAHLDAKRITELGISRYTPFSEGILSCIIKGTFTNILGLPKID